MDRGVFNGQRSLVGYSPWGRKESDMTKRLTHTNYCSYAVLCLVVQSCLTLCGPWTVACQTPLSMGILQVRILEWVAMAFSRGSSYFKSFCNLTFIFKWLVITTYIIIH